ncbi:MAG: hypothetical protein KAW02_07070 [candidate division Zixibacteria bacterium]|nr:hypothetical protein [candidate division Zixibacteria bacterium]
MKDESSFKNLNDLKTKIEKLISFQEKGDQLKPPRKVKDENPDSPGLLSKYAQVLCCSFEKVETIEQQTIKLPQAIPKKTHPKKEGDSPGRDSS